MTDQKTRRKPSAAGTTPQIDDNTRRILEARHHDPFQVLGRHLSDGETIVRVFLPHAAEARIADGGPALERVADTDLFVWRGASERVPSRYRVAWQDGYGTSHVAYDPYCFPPLIGDLDLHLFGEGRHWHAYRFLGANRRRVDGVDGVLFATWAPSAERVSVVGDFNHWDGRRHMLRARGGSGVWELFVPELEPGRVYKFEIRNRETNALVLKTDPYGRQFEMRPATAAIVTDEGGHRWHDQEWLRRREHSDWLHTPTSVYEVHLGSWQKGRDASPLSYRDLAVRLVDYVGAMGFTHIELLPITEHPLDQSWGYQTTGYFAPTSRFGPPDDFRFLVDHCHRSGIGVILDWVPAHFPRDMHALARFDGSALYEHEDPRRGEHRDWGTMIFNYGRNEVRNFLISSALFWIEEFHVDGLRVDAVASMLYLDYSRSAGEWLPNRYGGNENLEAIDFLRQLNEATHGQHPGTLTMAEESTSWPQVTRPAWLGGLGFSMKWNMGWMHDTLEYMSKEPVFRRFHHDWLTFGLLYAYSENFMLSLSHDEVVHLKRALFEKMPGDRWQRFANLRLLYTYMWTYPGKKLLFMGGEFAVYREWNESDQLEWQLLEYPEHRGVHRLVTDLNQRYRESPALHAHEFEPQGFEWIDCHDSAQSIISYLRLAQDHRVVVVLNFTPVPRHDYRIGVPQAGFYREWLNSDSEHYGGSNVGNDGGVMAEAQPHMGRPFSLTLTLPPIGAVVLVHEAPPAQ